MTVTTKHIFQARFIWSTCCWTSTSCTRSRDWSVTSRCRNSWLTLSTDTNPRNFQIQTLLTHLNQIFSVIQIWSDPSTFAVVLTRRIQHVIPKPPEIFLHLHIVQVKRVKLDNNIQSYKNLCFSVLLNVSFFIYSIMNFAFFLPQL